MLWKFNITSVVRFTLSGAQISLSLSLYLKEFRLIFFLPDCDIIKESGKMGKDIHIVLSELKQAGV